MKSFCCAVSLLACVPFALAAEPSAADLGLKLAPGFKITQIADHEIANDIYCMTLDSKGRVVVGSQNYIRILEDSKGTGKLDKATLFAVPEKGVMGLCADGNDLLYCGDGWFGRYRDKDGDGKADGPPEKIAPMAFGEHGGHAMRKGPDGWWYVIGGNDTRFTKDHVTLPSSPIPTIEAGALLRYSPDLKQSECVAHGWRNPYDFDFNAQGDLFTYDSDTERDLFLPWYMPTRVYHVGHGQHHGWRLEGYLRSWCRKPYYLDTVDVLWPVGRGSPTGVACYRHTKLPERYRGGLFILDWTFGRVWFLPLEPDGTTYKTRAEVFLEPTGTHGFAPTDIVVAPDGSLLVSIGGRRTRGAIYRIEYTGELPKEKPFQDELDQVLRAPQPLDAWSRAKWEPLAKTLGPEPFRKAVAAPDRNGVRAVEILTELFGGLGLETAKAGAKSTEPLVRARVAWSLGRAGPTAGCVDILKGLAVDQDPRVRISALDALADRFAAELDTATAVLQSNLIDSDKRVNQAAVRLASALPATAWQKYLALEYRDLQSQLRSQLMAAQVGLRREPNSERALVYAAFVAVPAFQSKELRLPAVRLLMLAFGDYNLKSPPTEVQAGYSLMKVPVFPGMEGLRRTLRPILPSGDEILDLEVGRLLAMIEDDEPATVRKVTDLWTGKTSATSDMHYLVVLSRLRASWPDDGPAKTATSLLSLGKKLQGQEQRDKQNWSTRLAELTGALLKNDPRLADEMVKHPLFVSPGHVALAHVLPDAHKKEAARLFLATVKKDAGFDWSGPLIDLLKLLPAEEIRPVFRAQWENFGLRDALADFLAQQPDEQDRDKFLTILDSGQPKTLRDCLKALETLRRDDNPKNLVPLFVLLRRLQQEPKESALRQQTLALINRQAGQSFAVKEPDAKPETLRNAYQPAFDWLEKAHPALAKAASGAEEDPEVWKKLLASVDWAKGDASKGETTFRTRACVTCHAGTSRLGPDLIGVAGRMSRDDLFDHMINPSKEVAPLYRVTVFELASGQVASGIVVFFSADGIILQTDATTTLRIAAGDILNRQPTNRSLMPTGLLKDLKPADLADLYSYMQTLKAAPKMP